MPFCFAVSPKVREGEKPARVVTAKGKGGKGAKQQRAASPSPASSATAAAAAGSSSTAAAAASSKQEEEASLASGSTKEGGAAGDQRSVELFGFWQVRDGGIAPLICLREKAIVSQPLKQMD